MQKHMTDTELRNLWERQESPSEQMRIRILAELNDMTTQDMRRWLTEIGVYLSKPGLPVNTRKPPTLTTQVSEIIKKYLSANGLNQKQFASITNLSVSCVCCIINGKPLSMYSATKLEKVLGISAGELMGLTCKQAEGT